MALCFNGSIGMMMADLLTRLFTVRSHLRGALYPRVCFARYRLPVRLPRDRAYSRENRAH